MHFSKPLILASFIYSTFAVPLNEFHLDQIKEIQSNQNHDILQYVNKIIEYDEDVYNQEEEEEEDGFSPDFPEFQNAETNEFFENLPKHLREDKLEQEEVELNEEIGANQQDEDEEEQDIQIEIEEEEENHHHHIPIQPNIPWQRPGSERFYQETRIKSPQISRENTHDTLKFGFLFLGSLFIYALLKFHRVSLPLFYYACQKTNTEGFRVMKILNYQQIVMKRTIYR